MAAIKSVRREAPQVALNDQQALLRMLAYIETECLRLGVQDAAQHVAMAAALLPVNWADRPAAAFAPAGISGLQ